jgi:hypothetical protein
MFGNVLGWFGYRSEESPEPTNQQPANPEPTPEEIKLKRAAILERKMKQSAASAGVLTFFFNVLIFVLNI